MTELEKVIYSIERCICHVPDACRDCAYDAGHPYNECVELLLKDALSLLKAKEAVEPKVVRMNAFGQPVHVCGKCGYSITESMNYCSQCGRAVKWDD